jgi:hypothetical protein
MIGGPATVFRVLRDAPPAPVPPPDSEKVFASPADYHDHSFFTYRWVPLAHHTALVYRAMDDAVFQADLAMRPRPPLSDSDQAFFPDPGANPSWTDARRQQAAAELNALNSLNPADLAAARAAYRGLSNDGLRVLAGLPGVEKAFARLTPQPLDPADPRWLVLGPDVPAGSLPAGQLAYVDTLDGRADNRYLYRSAYVNKVHHPGPLGLASAPVWLPGVTPPRTPELIRLIAAERQITLEWFSGPEPDLAEYQVYRSDDPAAARDIRLMTLVQTVAVPPGDPSARPPTVTWTDTVPGLVTFSYRLIAVDTAGNASSPSATRTGRAHDTALPVVPIPSVAWVARAGVTLAQLDWTSDNEVLVQRLSGSGGSWVDLGQWQQPGSATVRDPFSDPAQAYQYRLWARKYTGAVLVGSALTLEPQS